MAHNERIRGAQVSRADVIPLSKVIQDCHLFDLKATGAFFTWNNKHESGKKVYSRIDRVFINYDWINVFPDSVANFLPEGLFDHCSCLINLECQQHQRLKSFKYYNMWSLSKDFDHIDPLNSELCHTERICDAELGELLKARNMFLSQKAKTAWIAEGNENTSYFHSVIKRRRSQNRVYKAIIKMGQCLTDEHRTTLLAPLSDNEIKRAMFDIPGNKAPSPDGFGSQFFKDAWHIMGHSVTAAIRDAFNKGKVLKQCNNTVITLIPKVELFENVKQFRLIACCNTIYKCLSKVICNRLRDILPDIVSPSQSAFIKGRDIVGNILICQDLIRLYKRKACSSRMLMKLDLQKAYDLV
ncbi:uncharacterized protein LOC141640736 [Silene latifolia]|uniref:uncharacterized protein LOC141640736 n=1 Tax=Silene latifolia TaxID=37657 RepID=UPI003D774040